MVFVLLVEDNPSDAVLVQLALKHHSVKHVLHVIRSKDEALHFINRMGKPDNVPLPDVLLLDLLLPDTRGEQILAEFRKHPGCSDLPVIAVTASDGQDDRDRVNRLGVSGYFCKPTELKGFMELGAIVRDLVKRPRQGVASTNSGASGKSARVI